MPRLLRDSPLNGIWEGSGNVMSLDVLRAMAREPDGLPAFLAECELARGADARLDAHLDSLPATLGALAGEDAQWLARRAVEDLALAFQASLLVRRGSSANRKWMPDHTRASTMSSHICEKLVNVRVTPFGAAAVGSVVPLNVASSRP